MCGRFVNSLRLFPAAIRFYARLTVAEDAWQPTWNDAPTQLLPAVIQAKGENRLGIMRWGRPRGFSAGMHVNAIGAPAASLKTFARSLESRRCIVPATGFYERQANSLGKQPWYVEAKESVEIDGKKEARFILLTCHPSPVVREAHYRSPVLVWPAGSAQAWLNPACDVGTLGALTEDSSKEPLTNRMVSMRVDKAGIDGEDLVMAMQSAQAVEKPTAADEVAPEQ